uniref:Uncharacterized protein n=1 Tax=Trypanosoma congolense (strain IL3000) TaxID=1068625 RepID=G0UNQ6_TRYCI|nr:conserved hypothetical protein [Trypanosoma congolense IL3000]
MKGLEDWLASSSSSSSPNPKVSSTKTSAVNEKDVDRKITQSNVRERKDELRNRMRTLLGESAVTSVVTEESMRTIGDSVPPAPSLVRCSSDGGDLASTGSKVIMRADGDLGGASPQQKPKEIQYRSVEVMVVDRGTQTTTTVGCQTETDIPSMFMESGSPFRGACCHCCSCCHTGGLRGLLPRRPQYDENLPSRFNQELETIQKSIDMLIARYNLPPPPLAGF